MRHFIIVVYIGLFCISLKAQTWPEYAESIERQVFACSDVRCRNELLLTKIDSALKNCSADINGTDVARDLRRIAFDDLPMDLKSPVSWNGALLAYTLGEYGDARMYFNRYVRLTNDTSMNAHFLSFLIAMERDSILAAKQLTELVSSDSVFMPLHMLMQKRWTKDAKTWPYILAGALLPGSGLMAEGFVSKGLTALLLNSASAMAIVALLRANLYFNLATWGVMLVQKFYLGQLNLSNQLFVFRHPKKLNKQHLQLQQTIDSLLIAYPIQYKSLSMGK